MTDLGCALRADSLAAAQGDEQPAAIAAVQDGAPHLRRPLEPRRGQGPYRARIPHRGAEDHQEGALLWGTCVKWWGLRNQAEGWGYPY